MIRMCRWCACQQMVQSIPPARRSAVTPWSLRCQGRSHSTALGTLGQGLQVRELRLCFCTIQQCLLVCGNDNSCHAIGDNAGVPSYMSAGVAAVAAAIELSYRHVRLERRPRHASKRVCAVEHHRSANSQHANTSATTPGACMD